MCNTSTAPKQNYPYYFCGGSKGPPCQRKGEIQKHFVVRTFLLLPLDKIFKAFCNPANNKYAWIGAEELEIIFLNDFRWTPELIPWERLLVLLEGGPVHFPTPRNHFVKDIKFDKDTPIFATSRGEIKHCGKHNVSDERENEMMVVRWKIFKLHQQITEAECKEVPTCPRCFSELALLAEITL